MSRFSLNYLGIFFIIISLLSFFNIIYSYYFNLYLNIYTYIFTLFISLIIGAIAGTLSVVGYVYIQPYLKKKLKLHDTCGVHNLHGMPGILGGISGFISASVVSDSLYGDSIQHPTHLFP